MQRLQRFFARCQCISIRHTCHHSSFAQGVLWICMHNRTLDCDTVQWRLGTNCPANREMCNVVISKKNLYTLPDIRTVFHRHYCIACLSLFWTFWRPGMHCNTIVSKFLCCVLIDNTYTFAWAVMHGQHAKLTSHEKPPYFVGYMKNLHTLWDIYLSTVY